MISPFYRREGHHRDRDGFHGDSQSRGGDRDRPHGPHERQRRDPPGRHITDTYEDRSGLKRERRRGDYDASASDEHRIGRNRDETSRGRDGGERFPAPGMSRNERRGQVPHPEGGQLRRERERVAGQGRERVNERRRPRRERSEEEDISNYEYASPAA